jgi:DNA-binding FadR family transcriptional regulator
MNTESFSAKRKNLSEQVADYLEEYILSEDSIIGEKLPGEQTLAEKYKVSRPIIREAYKLLMERGLIIQKNGNGAFISKPDKTNIYKTMKRIVALENIEVEELHQLRVTLEVEAARLAATNASELDFIELEKIVETMETDSSLTLLDRVHLDIDFHNLVAKSSGNTLLEMFVNVMTGLITNYMAKGAVVSGGIPDANEKHMVIIKAIKTRDGEKAANAMLNHLHKSRLSVEVFNKNKIVE